MGLALLESAVRRPKSDSGAVGAVPEGTAVGTVLREPGRRPPERRPPSRFGQKLVGSLGAQVDARPRRVGHGHVRPHLALPEPEAEPPAAGPLLRDALRLGLRGGRVRARSTSPASQPDAPLARHLVRLDAALLVPGPHVPQHLDPGHLDLPPVRQRPVLRLGRRRLLRGHLHPRLALRPRRGPALPRTGARSRASGSTSAWRCNPTARSTSAASSTTSRPSTARPAPSCARCASTRCRADDAFLKRNWPQHQAGHRVADRQGRQRRRHHRRQPAQHARHRLVRPGRLAQRPVPGRAAGRPKRWPARWATRRSPRSAATIFETRPARTSSRSCSTASTSSTSPTRSTSTRSTPAPAARSTRCSARAGPSRSGLPRVLPEKETLSALQIALALQLHARRRPVSRGLQAGPLVRHARRRRAC